MPKIFSRVSFFLLLVVVLIFSNNSYAQFSTVNISGIVSEKGSGEILIGANVLIYSDSLRKTDPLRSVTTNKFGFYSLPAITLGNHYIFFSSLGYERKIFPLKVDGTLASIRFDIQLESKGVVTDQVVIEDRRKTDFTRTTSTIEVDPKLIQQLPAIGGETDVFRALQLLPGVTSATELSTGIYVRGGSSDQNLTLIDGVPIYNPSHLGGFASTFNPESIQDLKLIKGAFPAEYGGRLSSVLDVTLKEGSSEKFSGVANVNTISSRLTMEGPFAKNATFIFSTRVMYLDKILPLFPKAGAFPLYNFYDLNGKINYKISATDKIFVSGFFSKDNILEPPDSKDVAFDIGWSNATLNLTWTKLNSATLFTNTSLVYTSYGFSTLMKDKIQTANSLDFYTSSKVSDFSLKNETQISIKQHLVKLGIGVTYHHFNTLTSDFYLAELKYQSDLGRTINALEASFYAQDEIEFFDLIKLNGGIRADYFQDNGLIGIEPRISATVYLLDRLLLRGAFALCSQPLHLLSRNDIYLPTDVWYPSSKNILPSRSMQAALGLEATSIDRTFLFSAEAYYKKLDDLVEYKETASFGINSDFEQQITKGYGEAYGLELFLNKRIGDFKGWIGYTVSWTRRFFDDLNRGNAFFPRYDRRHDVSLVLTYDVSSKFKFGATWVYGTGQAYSLPVMQYGIVGLSNPNINNFQTLYQYSDRDAFRLPAFHKLDVSFKYIFDVSEHDFEVSLDIYNVYNRFNAFSKYIGYTINTTTGKKEPVLKQFTLFPFLPSLGIKYKF